MGVGLRPLLRGLRSTQGEPGCPHLTLREPRPKKPEAQSEVLGARGRALEPLQEPQEVPELATTVCEHAQKCAPSLDTASYLPERFAIGSLSSQPPGSDPTDITVPFRGET